MKFIESIREVANEWLQVMMTESGVWQLLIIIIAALLAGIAHNRWQAFIVERIGRDERQGLRRMALRGSGRVIFPLVMALLVLTGSAVMESYTIGTPLLNLLTPLLLSLAIIRIVVYALRRAFGPSTALRAWEGLISTLIWAGVAMHLLGWLPVVISALDGPSVTLGEVRLSILSLMKFAVSAAAFIVLARWLSRAIEQRTKRSEYLSGSMQVGLSKISKVLLYTIAILIALNSIGINLTSLAVFGGALGVGLGFGLQRIASNFISGFILLFDRSIKPGDVITVGNRFGWVVGLHARYIVVRDRDGVETLIPNENLITSEVTNWSYSDKHVRVKVPVQISYGDDPELAMEIMKNACEASGRVLSDPPPQVRMLAFGDNGIELELRLWLDDPEGGVGSVKSEVNLAIWKGFKEQGITIPFPQRVIHIQQPATEFVE